MNKLAMGLGALLVVLFLLGPISGTTDARGQTIPVETVTLTPVRDNTLYQSSGAPLSNGQGDYLFAGMTNQPADDNKRRAVIAFDIAAALPAGATVVDAELTLTLSKSLAGTSSVMLHRLTTDWGEGASDAAGPEGSGAPAETGDATWLHTFFDGGIWTKPGGEYTSAASASAEVGDANGEVSWESTQLLVEDVQRWLDRPLDDHGWILIGDESAVRTAKRFNSREHPTESSRPRLTIQYRPPKELVQIYLPLIHSP